MKTTYSVLKGVETNFSRSVSPEECSRSFHARLSKKNLAKPENTRGRSCRITVPRKHREAMSLQHSISATFSFVCRSCGKQQTRNRPPPTSIVDSWMRASLENIRPRVSAENDGVLADAIVDRPRSRACLTTGSRTDISRSRRKTPLGPQSPGTRKIRQRIHDAQAALRSLRNTTS